MRLKVSVEDACDSGTSIGTYSLLLHSYIGRSMLEFQVKNKETFISFALHKYGFMTR